VNSRSKTRTCRQRVFRLGVTGILLIAVSGALPSQGQVDPVSAACSAKYLSQTATAHQFVLKAYASREDDRACLEVRNLKGDVAFRQANKSYGQYTLGQTANAEYNAPGVANGTDVTGRGRPDMIVSLYTGGAHCCSIHYVFELEPEFKLLATLNDADDDMAHFMRFANESRYYYSTADWAFAYWPGSFASSPSEPVVLSFAEDASGGGFHLALHKMRRPAPTPAQWKQKLESVQKALEQGQPVAEAEYLGPTLWQYVIDLIYTGHSDLAWKFLDEAGPAAQAKPLPNLADFCALLKTSLYWPDLEKTIQNAPPSCASVKPKTAGM
jgi:hypothetical protein